MSPCFRRFCGWTRRGGGNGADREQVEVVVVDLWEDGRCVEVVEVEVEANKKTISRKIGT